MREFFDDMMERRIIGKLATILVAFLVPMVAGLIVYIWTTRAEATPNQINQATLEAANAYTDRRVAELNETMQWMAATMEVKWNVRRPRSR